MTSNRTHNSSHTSGTHQSYGDGPSSSSFTDPIAYYQQQRHNRQKAVFNREMHIMLQNKFTELRWKHFPERPAKSIASIPCSFLAAKQHKNSESEDSDEEMSSGEVSSTDESSSDDSSVDSDDLESSSEESDDLDRGDYPKQAFGSDSLHYLLWYNEKSKIMNSGDCQCQGFCINRQIKREVCEGEQRTAPCDPVSNNLYRLHHYVIVITPPINFQLKVPSSIRYGGAVYDFSGFSMFSHQRLDNVPDFSFRRYRMEYTARLIPTPTPQNFWIKDIDLISDYIMKDLLELYDFDCGESRTSCCRSFHFMPRYIHGFPGTDVSELLGSDIILAHLLTSFVPLFEKPPSKLGEHWRHLSRSFRDAIVTQPEKRPRCLRVDDIYDPRRRSRSGSHQEEYEFPDISHKGKCKSDQRILTSKRYENLLKRIKILTKRVTAKPDDIKSKNKLAQYQDQLNTMKNKVETSVDVVVSSKGFRQTGIFSDVCQQALLIPSICHHIKYHWSLGTLEAALNHTFKSRTLLEISLTHESYESTFGTTPIHIKNSLSNCGVCQPFYGSFEKSSIRNKKKGLMALISTMSELGSQGESFSNIKFNESLEFLGDAVIDLLCSTRLFYLLPKKPEGTLSIFRSALVQNYHLYMIGKGLEIQKYMLISDWRKMEEATSGCIESITAVVYLEDGLYEADKFISRLIFKEEELQKIWLQPYIHPLQAEYPEGDRFFINSSNVLKKLVDLENRIGITFRHIRLLAKAFTHPSAGLNTLTRGNNQRLEFLGDAVLKFIASDYVYKHFPDHNEGHLTLLRNSLISAKCQFRVACDMGLQQYIDFGTEAKMPKNAKQKLLADVFEAFVAAVYVDRDLKYCKKICEVLLFTRLESVILNQDWIDPKSQLQSCCLTVPRGPGMSRYPKYKVLEEFGNSDNKTFKVGVYLNKKRLGTGRGKSKRQAEMDAAADALKSNFFGVLRKQRRILNRKLGHRKVGWRERMNYPS